jgi:hypothetical protein
MNIVPSNGNLGTLTPEESAILADLELCITDNFRVFFRVGSALTKIRDRKLYRQTHGTFEEYCRERFDIAARTAYQYIEASETVQHISECAQIAHILPANESQVRPLTRLDQGAQLIAWETAITTCPDGKITARHVASVVSTMLGEQIQHKASREQQKTKASTVLPESIKEALWSLIEQVRDARLKALSKETRADLKARIQGILNLLED